MSNNGTLGGQYRPVRLNLESTPGDLDERNLYNVRTELTRTPIEIETRLHSLRICLRDELTRRASMLKRRAATAEDDLDRSKQLILQLAGNIEAFEWMFNDEKWIHREFVDG